MKRAALILIGAAFALGIIPLVLGTTADGATALAVMLLAIAVVLLAVNSDRKERS